jgi:hypothetical protein
MTAVWAGSRAASMRLLPSPLRIAAVHRHARKSLSDLMKATETDKMTTHGYHRFYEDLLAPLRYKDGLRMLEIGVNSGNSMATGQVL